MLKTFVVAVAICLLVATSFSGFVHAQQTTTEQVVPLNQVPLWLINAARVAAKQYFGSAAVIISAATDPEGDFLTYEFKGAVPGSLGFEIDVFPDGRIDEVEEVIELSKVPPDVLAHLGTLFPGFQPTLAERSTRPGSNGLNAVWYEFEGRLRGTDVDIEVNAVTKTILIEAN